MKLKQIAEKYNIPVYKIEIEKPKKARKQRSDKGKKRGSYKPKNPNELLKREVHKVNKNLIDTQKRLEKSASKRTKNKISSTPAALQAVKNWADSSKKGYLFEKNDKGYTIFNEKEIDKLIESGDKEKIRTLREMIEGNKRTDERGARIGMINAKSLTTAGRESIHQDAYQTFVKQYSSEIGPNGMTKEEYDELWTLFNEYKKQLEDEGAYAIFYSDFQNAVKNGLLKSDSLDWQKWLLEAVEQIKRDREAMI